MFLTTISPEDVMLALSLLLVGCILPASVTMQIVLYQALSGVLGIMILWTTLVVGNGWAVLLILIPIGFAVFIRWIAMYIADPEKIRLLTIRQQIVYSLLGRITFYGGRGSKTMNITLSSSGPQRLVWLYPLLGLALIAFTFALAPYLPVQGGENASLRLAVALVLVLMGICTWLVRKDLISQAIGLLVMDDGLLLLSESVVHRMELTFVLVVIVFLYLLVPLTCLLLVMPRLRQATLQLDVDQVRKLRG